MPVFPRMRFDVLNKTGPSLCSRFQHCPVGHLVPVEEPLGIPLLPLALYTILAHKGFFPVSELEKFLEWEGTLGGHPDRTRVPGVEASTGSLGHGFPMAIGVALALRAKRINRRVYVLIGDGESNEGTVWEAVLLAGNLGLSNLTAILINNHSSTRDLGDIAAKYTTFRWQAMSINGRDQDAIEGALSSPAGDRPSLVVAEVTDSA